MEMDWLMLATGATGGWTLIYLARWVSRLFVDSPSVSLHQAPRPGCLQAVVAEIRRARREVCVVAEALTAPVVAEALAAARKRNVTVDVVLASSARRGTQSTKDVLTDHGLEAKIDPELIDALAPVVIIDGQTVLTGGTSLREPEEGGSVESLLIIKGHRQLANSYRESFLKQRARAEAVPSDASPVGKIIPASPSSHGGLRKVAA
ncbi:MAG: phospholipase D-like domain-containing protein [Gemmataceae bacterium]|nr:phospholipase D-like domain-containing protein [Gemmataceae bacterium]MDW8266986.1 phospholipase D-like domain-containing protein [Gemmataceae bacterium]